MYVEFESIMGMDIDMLKDLVSTLGVTMQQPVRIRWANLKELYEKTWLGHNMLEKSFHKFKDFQTNIGELQRKYVALMNGNAPCGYFTSGKYWSELKSLHANHTASSEAF